MTDILTVISAMTLCCILRLTDLKNISVYNISKTDIAEYTEEKSGFDCYLKVTGSGFLIHNNKGIAYRMRDMYREKRYSKNRAVINCNISGFINRIARKSYTKANKRL